MVFWSYIIILAVLVGGAIIGNIGMEPFLIGDIDVSPVWMFACTEGAVVAFLFAWAILWRVLDWFTPSELFDKMVSGENHIPDIRSLPFFLPMLGLLIYGVVAGVIGIIGFVVGLVVAVILTFLCSFIGLAATIILPRKVWSEGFRFEGNAGKGYGFGVCYDNNK